VKKVNQLKTVMSLLFFCLCAQDVNAANITQVSRYATVNNKPLTSQVNPLLTIQQIHFPQQIHTVGEALSYWMQYSGYTLVDERGQSQALKDIRQQPLPHVVRSLGPLTVRDGLEVLVGVQVFSLVQDPLHRKVNFRLKPAFANAQTQAIGKRV
jgi:conjugative transfer region protein (TIGR03748 family)